MYVSPSLSLLFSFFLSLHLLVRVPSHHSASSSSSSDFSSSLVSHCVSSLLVFSAFSSAQLAILTPTKIQSLAIPYLLAGHDV
jgi:hypothetical protein